jgi:predicted transcriptional regulator
MKDYRLTNYELELMDAIWKRGEATVQEVCDDIRRDLAYTTVMTTLTLLCNKKKVLKRVKRGRAFLYKPTISREQVSRSMVHHLRRVLFGDSLPSLMLSMLSNEKISDGDIAAIKATLVELESRS